MWVVEEQGKCCFLCSVCAYACIGLGGWLPLVFSGQILCSGGKSGQVGTLSAQSHSFFTMGRKSLYNCSLGYLSANVLLYAMIYSHWFACVPAFLNLLRVCGKGPGIYWAHIICSLCCMLTDTVINNWYHCFITTFCIVVEEILSIKVKECQILREPERTCMCACSECGY